MGASDIAIRLKKRDPVTFGQISRNTIEGWIDRSSGNPRWKDSVLRRVENGHNPGHNKGGRQGILSRHPDVVESIKKRLTFLREGGATVNLITARAIIVATILHMKPDILEQKFKDGSTFRASDSFVRKFLHGLLSWSLRKATQAAQKLP
ncbi:hypothetical protein BGW80DRAFT_1188759, partial [Lactifluus volemus]